MYLVLCTIALLLAPHAARAQVAPSHSVPPERIRRSVINYADPPPASGAAPARVWQPAEVGLNNREYRERPVVSSAGAAAAAASAAASLRAAAAASAAAAPAAGRRRRRGLLGTALRVPPSTNTTSSGGASSQQQQQQQRSGAGTGGVGTYTFTGAGTSRPVSGLSIGFDGIGAPETNLIPEDVGLAVGRDAAIHLANSLVRFYRVDGAGKRVDLASGASFLKQVWLPDFFYAVTSRSDGAGGCDQGVFAAAAAYDKRVGRYLVSAICDDWLDPRIVLAVSASDSVTGYWNLYSAPADNLPTSWKCSNGERALPDFTQLGYNGDGVYVTWVAICREGVDQNQIQSGAMLYAFPKWAIYGGNDPSQPGKRFYVPVFTGQDLCEAVRDQSPVPLPPGGDCGASFTQLQPAAPQAPVDVRQGETFFVLDFWLDQLSRRYFILVALVATGTLWDHDGIGTPCPYLVGRFVDRGQDAYLNDDAYLRQNQATIAGAPDLDAGAVNPRGYWSGGAALSNNRLYVADRAEVVDPPQAPGADGAPADVYSPRPAVYWAWLVPTFTAYGPCACYWNFNWGYGYAWIWDKGCYNPVTGVVTGGGGGAYVYQKRRRRQQRRRRRRLQGTVVGPGGGGWLNPTRRDTSSVMMPAAGSSSLSSSSSSSPTASSSGSTSTTSTPWRSQQFVPNRVYTAAAGSTAYAMRTQAPKGARVVTPPAAREAAAARAAPGALLAAAAALPATAAAGANGTWATATGGVSASGAEAAGLRDAYMAAAYYDPTYGSWGVDFACRFTARWNERNTVTLLAVVQKAGVVTYGSGAGEADAPLGLAYPSVAVRGGAMLVTFTYASYADLAPLPGTRYGNAPAYPGVGYTIIYPDTKATVVCVAYQPDPTYGPILQAGARFGGTGSAIDIHPTTGRVWSANLAVWAPAYTFDDATVRSTAGARITIFS